jgi:hypothetical protein
MFGLVERRTVATDCTLRHTRRVAVVVMESNSHPVNEKGSPAETGRHAATVNGLKAYEGLIAAGRVDHVRILDVTLPTKHMSIFITVGDATTSGRAVRLSEQIRATIHAVSG